MKMKAVEESEMKTASLLVSIESGSSMSAAK